MEGAEGSYLEYYDSRTKVFVEIAEQVSDRVIDAEAVQFIACERKSPNDQ